jgi:chaperonin GroES
VPEPSAAPKRKVFRPVGDVLLIRRNEKPVSPLLEGVNVEKEKPLDGLVLAIGPRVKEFKVGMTVVFGKWAGTILSLNGEEPIMVHEEELLGELADEDDLEITEIQVDDLKTRAGAVVMGTWRHGTFYPADGSKPLIGGSATEETKEVGITRRDFLTEEEGESWGGMGGCCSPQAFKEHWEI